MIGLVAYLPRPAIPSRHAPIPSRDELADILVEAHAGIAGRLLALTRLRAVDGEGRVTMRWLDKPAIVRALTPADGRGVEWIETTGYGADRARACEYVFPVTLVRPHPDVDAGSPLYGFGRTVGPYGDLYGDAPKSAGWYLRWRYAER